MIRIDYSFDPSELRRIEVADLRMASPTELDYYLFCGDVVVRLGDAVIDARWGWVPLLDFATQLSEVVRVLLDNHAGSIRFTESEATIECLRVGNNVVVTAPFADVKVVRPLFDLKEASIDFSDRLLRELTARWPDLTENPAFKARRALIESLVSS